MAPTLSEIEQPPKLEDALAQQRQHPDYDCMPCRVMGSLAFTGLGIYTWASGMSQLRQRELAILKSGSRFGVGMRKMSVFGLSATLVGLGVYRLVD